jgi:hypothetical protein
MLIRLTKGWRLRAAIALAAVYAVCVLAPPMALAFADGAVAARCLTDDHLGAAHVHGQSDQHGPVHAHGDGTVHKHAGDAAAATGDDSNQTQHAGSCCGLFCFAAVTGDPDFVVGQPVHASSLLPTLDEYLAGRGPDRINRPPITLLSL